MTPLAGVVLAGGSSRRMGRPKATIAFRGGQLIDRPLDALQKAGAAPVFVVGGDRSSLQGLSVEIVPDDHPGEGPLGGIVTALRHVSLIEADRDWLVAVLACDMPLVGASIVRAIADDLGLRSSYDACVPRVAGRPEPLCACYRLSALGALEEAFLQGVRSPTAALGRLRVLWFESEKLQESDLADVDTPDDLDEMCRIARARTIEE